MGMKQAIMGWCPSKFETYQYVFEKYGGTVNAHPDIIYFFMSNLGLKFEFWHYKEDGEVVAAYFISEGKIFGLNVWKYYPVSRDEVIMPFSPHSRLFVPVRSNDLSLRHRVGVMNAFYYGKRKICIVKSNFSAKTEKKRNGELKQFLSCGGGIFSLRDMTASEIARLYIYLFKKRFGESVRCYRHENLVNLLSSIPGMIEGNVLFFKGTPCALDLVLCSRSNHLAYYDVPNGGMDPEFSAFSPGSLLMWANICDARAQCGRDNREMIFSIGRHEANWDYKLRWAEPQMTGRIISL
ncbi:Mig-14 family protein [Enterobacter sp. CGMCC 5087]|uniref:GNAT family N-acetyltransferase n=1 Tax=Enterobacter sp. CGMCC 5087 TaxID=2183878 RepID=UPI000D673EA1|nr:GNAT family N-acetyltransferase [Enterobacter sp. CGMCC 5087]PWI77134.1 Mig-14 family protein [Enterobacter sp. CGMCC 5087]